ncbi:MAG: GDP-mannose 4,6-dehydratase [Candidatus Peribacteraceae bacterium]|jgi:GDPmannose 4,6-dehydratase|nr:GDP-mannose 4,6-dehydratase [Candidatus Peribacteraceae bacterium]
MAKVALVTGITGQDGSYLAELLLEKGYEVHGIVRRSSTFNRERIDHLFSDVWHPDKSIELHYGDLGDSNSLLRILMKIRPDEIYNLAAQSHVGISFDIPEYTSDVTGMGVVRFLELIRSADLSTRFYQASSSELFGKVLETPQTEMTPFYPRSPYACAKAYANYITRNYRESYGLYACNGILFNHESPRRGKNFVTRKIAYSLAAIKAGKQDRLHLGNLEAQRDWGYAPEYVEGMWRMLQQDEPEDFLLATGRTASVREFLEYCLGYAGFDFEKEGEGAEEKYIDKATGNIIVEIDPRYYRPAEVDELCGNPSKAKEKLGWEAKVTLEQLAEIMLEADMKLFGIPLRA